MMGDMTRRYLSLAQIAERRGVAAATVAKDPRLPRPDVVVGPLDEAGQPIPRVTVRGWLPSTVDRYLAEAPGRGRWGPRGDG